MQGTGEQLLRLGRRPLGTGPQRGHLDHRRSVLRGRAGLEPLVELSRLCRLTYLPEEPRQRPGGAGLVGVHGQTGLEIGPGRALVITYVNPVVAVTLGVIVLDERPGAGAVAGLLLILAGSWLSTDGRLPPRLTVLFRRPVTRGGDIR